MVFVDLFIDFKLRRIHHCECAMTHRETHTMKFETTDGTPNGTVTRVMESGEKWNERTVYDHNIETDEQTKRIAAELTALTGDQYFATSRGTGRGVVRAPHVGDLVSRAFNGDYYPEGEIVHVTKGTHKVVKTSTGATFYRSINSGAWVSRGWSLVGGHVSKLNPHF